MRLGNRTRRLVREAMVLGFAEGAWWAGPPSVTRPEEKFPRDSEIEAWVYWSARSNKDRFPLLGRVEPDAPTA